MKLKEIYEKAIEIGIRFDPRGMEFVKKELEKKREEFEKIPEQEKKFFDKESLKNPYGDTRILFGTGEEEIRKIFTGIDIDTGELMLAKNFNADLVIAHHPRGIGLLNLYNVMKVQEEINHIWGVPINIVEKLLGKRISEVERSVHASNAYRAVDSAKLLNLPFMCCHTAADNCVTTFLTNLIEKERPEYIKDLMDLLLTVPEYEEAEKMGFGLKIYAGNKKSKAGKIVVDMTGGTEGAKEMMKRLSDAGVGTIVGMHFSEEHRKEAEKNYINLLVASHMASDSIGMNIILDEIEKNGVEIIPFSGLIRVRRY